MFPTIKWHVVAFITSTLLTKAEYLTTTNVEVNVDGSSIDLDNNVDKIDFGVTQKVTGSDEEISKTRKIIKRMEKYFRKEVNVKPKYDKVRSKCKNRNELCAFWASVEECEKNPEFMTRECAPACRKCDQIEQPGTRNVETTLDESSIVMDNNVDKENFGVTQKVSGSDEEIFQTQEVIKKMEHYFQNEVNVKPEYDKVRKECKNRNELCAHWVTLGECEKNPKFMTVQCAAACRTCDQIDISNRCPLDPNARNAVGPGDLYELFEKVSDEKGEFGAYEPKILARPFHPDGSVIVNGEYAPYKKGPWVVTFDNFLTSEECDTLVKLGHEEGFKRSSDVGATRFDGTFEAKISEGRTSENAWCQNVCYENPVSKRVIEKIQNLTGFPEENSEYLQLLKYEVGQRYKEHHDYILEDEKSQSGPRVLTLFLYLNDVEGGGGTNFPYLGNITVMPKKGKALLWPSVMNTKPWKKDGMTVHEAFPVEKGIKYAANAWLRLRDYKGPLSRGC